MKSLKLQTPEGVQDYLVEECRKKRRVEGVMRELFQKNGFAEIETPTFEYYDVFTGGIGAVAQESAIKFIDAHGRVCVLRPDLTMPVARVASLKLAQDKRQPLKLFYIGNAFGQSSEGGLQREFTQAGIEIMGSADEFADAEAIITAIDAIRACGLTRFKIELGQIDFFKGLCADAGLDEPQSESLRRFVDAKDMLSVEMLLHGHDVRGRIKENIMRLPMLYGGREILDQAYEMAKTELAVQALHNISAVYDTVVSRGYGDFVSIDLGLLPSLNYYTGILLRGIAENVGQPILTGGRYDSLCAQFGRDVPATGFAIGVKRLLIALEAQDDGAFSPETITVALSKGRLAEKAMEIFTSAGLDCSCVELSSRKLVFTSADGKYRFILVKPSDVPTYVDRGVADIGVVGKDTLLEAGRPLYEMVDLRLGACKLCVCGSKAPQKRMLTHANIRVATKYANIAKEYYRDLGVTIDVIKLNGSVELGPILGLSDVILDIVESGKTLAENGLEVKEELFDISARLVVNQVSLKMKKQRINELVSNIRGVLNDD